MFLKKKPSNSKLLWGKKKKEKQQTLSKLQSCSSFFSQWVRAGEGRQNVGVHPFAPPPIRELFSTYD